jgi:hypothetical protein
MSNPFNELTDAESTAMMADWAMPILDMLDDELEQDAQMHQYLSEQQESY